ncbi:MAG: RNA 2',3'-cyclic phosphodiesterase [Propionibacteriaceae bacterium]|nr:RNA 2',3'-cyclic phosphodiesterase [Propionibacteriaceae bacterium]
MGARLFTALLPPARVVEDVDAFLQPRRDAEPRLRWTRPDGWHLTTAFLGDVPDRALDRLAENLAAAADRTPGFTLRLGEGVAFPWPLETKVLALGVPTGGDELAALARRCRSAAATAGVRPDGATFVPHLTLARANRPIDSTRLVRVLDTFESESWGATELVLVESHLRDRANRYEVLERWPLRALGSSSETAPPGEGPRP